MPKNILINQEMELIRKLIDEIKEEWCSSSTIRKLYRLSSDYPYLDSAKDNSSKRNMWFGPLINNILEELSLEATVV
jgi:hypothetical protein